MSKIFLGGTCNKSIWREQLIPKLKDSSFNPEVENWTPECMEEEIKQRETCEVCLYVITPKMTGVYSIAEVVDDSNKRPEKTVFAFWNTDGLKFTEHQVKSLMQTGKMVQENGARFFTNEEDLVAYLNSL